ncbi:MAG: winged helix-turn-helix domain-containing protein, partial [Actinobacteria bacterium]|nr:winged helix-turn-helix domain-containing protein [Actinomycetota bacterium]
MREAVRLRLLGPLEVIGSRGPVALGGPKERGVLTMLALSANQPVSESTLLDGVWGVELPQNPAKILQNNVLRLRKALRMTGAADHELGIVTTPGGYQLVTARGAVDVQVVDDLARRGRAAGKRGDHAHAASDLGEAVGHWRGAALADIADLPFALAAAHNLAELRVTLFEEWADEELALGHHVQLVPELERVITDEPYRESLRWRLMLALYRCDRQADALRAFQTARHALDELGLLPGAQLVELEKQIAARSSDLDWSDVVELPSGEVTFVVCDIEGSTRLFQRLGDAYPPLLARYHDVLRQLGAERKGVVVKTDGDGALIAFDEAGAGVEAAAALGLELAHPPWSEIPVRVRVGIATGAADPV